MSVDVIVLLEKSEEVVQVGQGAWREQDRPSIDLGRWRDLALELSRRAAAGAHRRAEIFLCLNEPHLVESYDHAFIEELLKTAHEHSWGGKVRIVADQRIENYDEHLDNVDSLKVWLGVALDSHAADVGLASFKRGRDGEHLPSPLRGVADSSEARSKALLKMVAPGEWALWPATWDVAAPLHEAPGHVHPYVPGRNYLIAVRPRHLTPSHAVRSVGELVRAHREGRFALGIIGHAAAPVGARGPRPHSWAELGREPNLEEVVEFGGLLELRYFLLRLNQLCPKDFYLERGHVEAVPASLDGALDIPNYSPNLLITSAFNPLGRRKNCWEAAQDVGRLLKAVTFRPHYSVHPGLRREDLAGLLDDMPEPTAWLYLGHGHGKKGLEDAEGHVYKAEEWLKAIRAKCRSLPLAFLSACSSADAAQRLAAAGVGVAVGFKGKVMPEHCRLLANPMIRAALDSHGDREVILHAFREGHRELRRGYGVEPRAFYAVR